MKTNSYRPLAVALALAVGVAACSSTSDSSKKKSTASCSNVSVLSLASTSKTPSPSFVKSPLSGGTFNAKPMLTTYANSAVIADYASLVSTSTDLQTALDAIQTAGASVTTGQVDTARQAWIDTRVAWESNEAMLFGPVEDDGIDPHIDTWPLDKAELNAAIASPPSDLSTASETIVGFHTIEYLLWDDNNSATGDGPLHTHDSLANVAAKLASDVNRRTYLHLLGNDLVDHTNELSDAWTTGSPSYGDTFTTAGNGGNTTYVSQNAALEAIVDGMVGIVDEVGTNKIATPFADCNPNEVESQYSFNSFIDFHNNINSILISYFGDFDPNPTAATNSFSNLLIGASETTLDTKIKTQIQDALDAMADVDNTLFHTDISDPTNATKIEAAQTALGTLRTTIDVELRAFVNDNTFEVP